MKIATLFLLVLNFCVSCQPGKDLNCELPKTDRMFGVSLVAPPNPYSKNPMLDVLAINAGWVAITPFAFQPNNHDPNIIYNVGRQWWGERPEGVVEAIRLAHEQGLKVMLKPQVWIPGGWVGDVEFYKEKDWDTWENGYRDYLLSMVPIADSMGVELFCVGTEYDITVRKRKAYWKDLIKDVREGYSGNLTYATNWDNYSKVPFWSDLDYIGVDAYFPLIKDKTPSISKLETAWKPYKKALKKLSCKYNKPILFTEMGYMSVDGCAHSTWELEGKRHQLAENQTAQANAYKALFNCLKDASWWAGGFVWKWYPNRQGNNGEGAFSKDYTPQGKEGELILRTFFGNKGL